MQPVVRRSSTAVATLLVLKVEKLLIDIEQEERQFPDSESTLDQQVRNGRAIKKEDCDRSFPVRCLLRVLREPARSEKDSVVVLSLNGPAESIDVRSSDRVIGPSLGPERPTEC
jgi:hypothetical protein